MYLLAFFLSYAGFILAVGVSKWKEIVTGVVAFNEVLQFSTKWNTQLIRICFFWDFLKSIMLEHELLRSSFFQTGTESLLRCALITSDKPWWLVAFCIVDSLQRLCTQLSPTILYSIQWYCLPYPIGISCSARLEEQNFGMSFSFLFISTLSCPGLLWSVWLFFCTFYRWLRWGSDARLQLNVLAFIRASSVRSLSLS